MHIPITYDRVKKLFSGQEQVICKNLIAGLKKSKQKVKNEDPFSWDWYLDVAQMVQGYSFAQVLAGETKKPRVFENTAHKIQQQVLDGTMLVFLGAAHGKLVRYEKVSDQDFFKKSIPLELFNYFEGPAVPAGLGTVFVKTIKNGSWVNEQRVIVSVLSKATNSSEVYLVLLDDEFSGGLYKADVEKQKIDIVSFIHSSVSYNSFFTAAGPTAGSTYKIDSQVYLDISNFSIVPKLLEINWCEDQTALVSKLLKGLQANSGFMALGSTHSFEREPPQSLEKVLMKSKLSLTDLKN